MKVATIALATATLLPSLPLAHAEEPAPVKPPAVPTLDDAAKKARDEEAKRLETEKNKAEEELKKEADSFTRRLKGDTAGKLWELVQKGDDDALKAIGLPDETLATLKTERPNLKGLHSILANEKLGKDVLKHLVTYAGSSKFAKCIEAETKAKEKAEKDRVREKKKSRRDRDSEDS